LQYKEVAKLLDLHMEVGQVL